MTATRIYQSRRTKINWWRWISILILGAALQFAHQLVSELIYRSNSQPGIAEYLQSIILAFFILEVLRSIRRRLDIIVTWESSTLKRFLIQLGVDISFVVIVILGSRFVFLYLTGRLDILNWQEEILLLIIGSIFVFIIVLIELGYYFLMRWRTSLAELEKFRKENIEFQFGMLKAQVNPHFLFNSLNTLSSLIHSNTEAADHFVRELSKVYRNVLFSKEKETIRVSEELDLLDSYLELMRLRFGDSLIIDINLQEKHLDFFIAPLTFQMLIENAVKHNIVEHDRPLRVEIYSETDHIVLRNNLQKKIMSQSSSQIGLKNISSRYLFLADSDIIVIDDEQYFTVKIPLLKMPYEGSNS